ncbi:MAG: hypothetical protein Q4C04_01980 [Clostridia bacterium]|nr:hypothetical protein [Clostridia bacterium]
MKTVRTILTFILAPLLAAATLLSLFSGIMRFVVLNPDYYKKHLADERYCEEMQEQLNDDLGYIAILYGLPESAMENFLSHDEIKSYTAEYIDAVFAREDATAELTAVPYPNNRFVNYILSNTDNSYEAAVDFGDDCAEAVQSNLWAVNQPLLLNSVTFLKESRIIVELTALFTLLLILTLGLSVLLFCLYIGNIRGGLTAVFGSTFCGSVLILAPLLAFGLKGYAERLNIALSAYRTQLTGIINSILEGGLWIAGLVAGISLVVLVFCAFTKKKRKKKKKTLDNG